MNIELTPLINFKDIHAGKKAFVCGSGTSLNKVPNKIIEDGIVICINASGKKFTRFDYLYCTDGATPFMAYWDEVVSKTDNIIFANPELEGFAVEVMEKTKKPVYLMTRNYDNPGHYAFNDDVLCMGNDAPISALNLAVVMGCDPIILCGIDMCYNEKGKRYFTMDAYNHSENSPYKEAFAKDYAKGQFTQEDYHTDKWLHMSVEYWKRAYTQNPGLHNRVFNASEISKLYGFKKIKL